MAGKETFKKILIEIVSVVFAVLLALGLNHWREDLAEKKLAKKALRNIIVEIQNNIEALSDQHTEYDSQILVLKKELEKIRAGEEPSSRVGYNHPILSNSAWTIANNTGAIKDMDLNLVLELSELYIFQEAYQDNGFSYFKVVTSPGYRVNEEASVESLHAQLTTSKQFGAGLKQGFERFLEDYKEVIDPLMKDYSD